MVHQDYSDGELPDLHAILLPRNDTSTINTKPLRRSPRKLVSSTVQPQHPVLDAQLSLTATSNQRRTSPAKPSPSKRSTSVTSSQANITKSFLNDVPVLPRKPLQADANASAYNKRSTSWNQRDAVSFEPDSLLLTFSKLAVHSDENEPETKKKPQSKSNTNMARTAARPKRAVEDTSVKPSRTTKSSAILRASRFVLDEARCEDDLVDSDAEDEGEDEDTDLSGFIVDDDAELSSYQSSDELDSEEERRSRRKAQKNAPRRRLQRGRKHVDDSDDENNVGQDLADALNKMQLNKKEGEHQQRKSVEVIDLTSPEPKTFEEKPQPNVDLAPKNDGLNLFDRFKALRLSPPSNSQASTIPSKAQPKMWSIDEDSDQDKEIKHGNDAEQYDKTREGRFTTPPTTPPRSPSKLKSPSKLLSPSKRGDAAQRSPHRQSMDAFWDLNEINEWHDQYSPKKAPTESPRKNRLAALDMWSDGELEDSMGEEGIYETSDSLPSPCESPTKPKSQSRPASPIKAEKQRLIAEKKAKQAEKHQFEATKEQMALDLLQALDQNITASRISQLSASTGGVKILWSKTLRSTAGRANWRRTVTKPSGSPVKISSNNKQQEPTLGTTIQHFANIELAVKVIDRPDRLINTLAHEFCHLANFMISGVRDQPHGTSFQNWARKVTSWMKTQENVPTWKTVEVTTKHGYVIEWKYLWVCAGREQNKAMEFLNLHDEDGCGAEYGRHSKSIDTDVHRCGRCQGTLVQVRPKPRASPAKKSVREVQPVVRRAPGRARNAGVSGKDVGFLEKMVEVVELSD